MAVLWGAGTGRLDTQASRQMAATRHLLGRLALSGPCRALELEDVSALHRTAWCVVGVGGVEWSCCGRGASSVGV